MPDLQLGIIAGSRGWHVRDLLRAGELLGLNTRWHDLTRVSSSIATGTHAPWHEDQGLVLRSFPSGSLEQTLFRLAALYRAHREGLLIINSPACFEACVDKFTTTARLAHAGLPVPPTHCCQDLSSALSAFEALGSDVVIKPLFGSEGKGLLRVADVDLAYRTFTALLQTGAVLYVQRFIDHPGHDVRAFVIGGKIFASMRRVHAGDWRTNLSRGARAETVILSDEERDLALRASATVDAEIAGVDLLPGRDGRWWVLEVNAVPGWKGLSAATGLDIAAAVLEHVRRRVRESAAGV